MAIACLILLGGFFAPAPPVELPGSATVTADGELDELVLRLRNPKLSLDERVAIEERLLALGESGARALQRSVEDRSRRVDERAKRTEKVYLAGFERAAKRAMTVRIDRAAQAEIEELQKQLGNLRGDDALSKERIHAEGDPARERLAQLLQTRISPVLDREPELAAARQSLLDDVYELEQEFALWRRCNQVISEPRRSKAFIDPTPRRPDVEKAEDWICVLALPMSDSDREVLLKNRAIAAELALRWFIAVA